MTRRDNLLLPQLLHRTIQEEAEARETTLDQEAVEITEEVEEVGEVPEIKATSIYMDCLGEYYPIQCGIKEKGEMETEEGVEMKEEEAEDQAQRKTLQPIEKVTLPTWDSMDETLIQYLGEMHKVAWMGPKVREALAWVAPQKWLGRAANWWDALSPDIKNDLSVNWDVMLLAIQHYCMNTEWIKNRTAEFERMIFRQSGYLQEMPVLMSTCIRKTKTALRWYTECYFLFLSNGLHTLTA
ncbi:hypothetical protein DXG01_004201 [Tephrocybe rancida]|nr:hypothetical protein DXG01_004201 [Tephrocybe rancida]